MLHTKFGKDWSSRFWGGDVNGRWTTHNDGGQPIAIGQLSDSVDLKNIFSGKKSVYSGLDSSQQNFSFVGYHWSPNPPHITSFSYYFLFYILLKKVSANFDWKDERKYVMYWGYPGECGNALWKNYSHWVSFSSSKDKLLSVYSQFKRE